MYISSWDIKTKAMAESGILQSLSKNYRAEISCARKCENIEFAQKKKNFLSGLMA